MLEDNNEIMIGIPSTRVGIQEGHSLNASISKVGGKAVLHYADVLFPDTIECNECKAPMQLLLQVYAPVDVERSLYIFVCNSKQCSSKSKGWRVLRNQARVEVSANPSIKTKSASPNSNVLPPQKLLQNKEEEIPSWDSLLDLENDQSNIAQYGVVEEKSSAPIQDRQLTQSWASNTIDNLDSDFTSLSNQINQRLQSNDSESTNTNMQSSLGASMSTSIDHDNKSSTLPLPLPPTINSPTPTTASEFVSHNNITIDTKNININKNIELSDNNSLIEPVKYQPFCCWLLRDESDYSLKSQKKSKKSGSGGGVSDEHLSRLLRDYVTDVEDEDPEVLQLIKESMMKRNVEEDDEEDEEDGGDVDEEEESEIPQHSTLTKQEKLFQRCVSRCPSQVFRYAYGGTPLWCSHPPPTDAAQIPPCSACGSPRAFELQVMPGILQLQLTSDAASPGGNLDFAVVAIYSCEKSCEDSNEEVVVVQKFPDFDVTLQAGLI